MEQLFWILIVFFCCLLWLMFASIFTKKKWPCTIFGWHKEPLDKKIEDNQLVGTCQCCGKKVTSMGRGGWY